MTIFLLIRHSDTDYVDNALAGRINSPINKNGQHQAETLAEHLASIPIQKILTSPLLRAQQTALPLSKKLDLPLQIEENFNQVSFGDWEGVPFEELNKLSEWKTFLREPSEVTPPNGESAQDVRQRVLQSLLSHASQYSPDTVIAVFSHGSIVRHSISALIGLPINQFNQLRIAPSSVSTIRITKGVGKLLHLNQQIPTRWI